MAGSSLGPGGYSKFSSGIIRESPDPRFCLGPTLSPRTWGLIPRAYGQSARSEWWNANAVAGVAGILLSR